MLAMDSFAKLLNAEAPGIQIDPIATESPLGASILARLVSKITLSSAVGRVPVFQEVVFCQELTGSGPIKYMSPAYTGSAHSIREAKAIAVENPVYFNAYF